MNRKNTCQSCTRRKSSAGRQSANPVPMPAEQTRANRSDRTEYLYWNDELTDDLAPSSDPQSGDVTDGSVDYFDFEWGEMVFHEESTMERRLFGCASVCESGCFGSGDDSGCEACETDCPESDGRSGDSDGGLSSGCENNRPAQREESAYEIVTE